MKIAHNSIWCYLFFVIVIAYALKGLLYPTGTISIAIALVELLICSFFLVKTVFFRKRAYIVNSLLLIIGVVTLSYLISHKSVLSTIFGRISTFTFFREFAGAVLAFFPLYYFGAKGLVKANLLKIFFAVIFVVSIFSYFYQTNALLETRSKTTEYITSNYAYAFVYLCPFIGLFKNKIASIPFFAIAIAMSMLSAKRGTILGVAVLVVVYIWYLFIKSKHKIFIGFILALLLIIAWHYILDYYLDNPYLKTRLEATLEGRSSGRDVILIYILRSFINSSLFQLIFGHGFASTVGEAGNYAHNDWIEFLYDFGIVGLGCYLSFYFFFVKLIKNIPNQYKLSTIMILVALFLSSLYSMAFFSNEASYSFMLLGYILGMNRYNKSIATNTSPLEHYIK